MHWERHQLKPVANATFKTNLNQRILSSTNVASPYSYIAVSQAFRDKKGQFLPKACTIDDKRMEDID